MKTMYERLRAVKNIYSDKFPQGLSILLVLFFLIFGSVSLLVLLHTQG